MSDAVWSNTDREINTSRTEDEAVYIGGKRFAGALTNVRPYYGFGDTKDVRCIKGFCYRDLKNRGFDNGELRTSVVKELVIHGGDIYAITMNSAYRLDNVCLLTFLTSAVWRDDILKLVADATKDAYPEDGVLSIEGKLVYHVTPEYFRETAKRLSPGEWVFTQADSVKPTLKVGTEVYVEEK
uniref:Methyltransferase n=1 Tax=Salmonella phage vB_SEnST11_KE22 TaxID=3161173 RepID=A0AAU8GE94_9CAUD